MPADWLSERMKISTSQTCLINLKLRRNTSKPLYSYLASKQKHVTLSIQQEKCLKQESRARTLYSLLFHHLLDDDICSHGRLRRHKRQQHKHRHYANREEEENKRRQRE